ncbi:MAG: DeoR/GlpR transcriptional regulator, partial [Akkermansia sp.]|nr:DeoR/GlpR transcriptional regulator [Akkermansia sp.]
MAQERRAYILRLLQQRGSIRSASLARELGVTDETIRTDLVDLQAQGLLKRVHGGARYTLPVGGKDASTRPDCQLARLALSHIKDDACIYLDDDPLALVLVSQLHGVKATLVTPSLKILSQLTAASLPHQVICPGGV